MPFDRTTRSLAIAACAIGLVAVGLLAGARFLNPYPADASCYSEEGYAAIKAHAQTNSSLALFALACAGMGAAVCLAGAVKATGHRAQFVLGVLPFVGLGFFSIVVLIGSGLYCQN